jgi:TRAP-type uncharacterized transport system substrate-binding protein
VTASAINLDSTKVITPQDAERKLIQLSREVDSAFYFLKTAEMDYATKKSNYEVSSARARIYLGQGQQKLTVSEKADIVLSETADEYLTLAVSEATVKSARANARRVETQVDIARSVGTSVRASLEI